MKAMRVLSIAAILSVLSGTSALTQEERPACSCTIKLTCPEEVAEKDKDKTFNVKWVITETEKGACGKCSIKGQVELIRGDESQGVSQFTVASTSESGNKDVDVTSGKLFGLAKEGDIIIVTVTITCVKDKKITCHESDACVIKVGKKKEEKKDK